MSECQHKHKDGTTAFECASYVLGSITMSKNSDGEMVEIDDNHVYDEICSLCYTTKNKEKISNMENEIKFKETWTLTDKEHTDIEKWKQAIKDVYGEYGNFEYRFSSGGGIGQVVKVYSEKAKIEKDFTDVDSW